MRFLFTMYFLLLQCLRPLSHVNTSLTSMWNPPFTELLNIVYKKAHAEATSLHFCVHDLLKQQPLQIKVIHYNELPRILNHKPRAQAPSSRFCINLIYNVEASGDFLAAMNHTMNNLPDSLRSHTFHTPSSPYQS